MSSKGSIEVSDLSKCFHVFSSPPDRLKQFTVPPLKKSLAPLARLAGVELSPSQYYKEFWALQDINFSVKPGETLGVVGRNGAGKSTLLQLVCGTLSPTTGRANVNGRVAALLELGSGFNPDFTGRENVFLNASVLGLSTQEIEAKLDDILAFADIGDFIDQPVQSYSSGMAMRLAFAVIAHVDADVLIVDEALAVGDAYFQQKCMRWLRRFRECGTVLFCGHDTSTVLSLCSTALWLENGQVAAHGDAKEVCEAYNAAVHEQAAGLTPVRRKIGDERKQSKAENRPKLAEPVVDEAQAATLKQIVSVFEFDEFSDSFGSGDAKIESLTLTRPDGSPLGLIKGDEEVCVTINALGLAEIEDVIVGFHVKDRLGQPLIGNNTFATYVNEPLRLSKGGRLTVRFTFRMPCLMSGEYSITGSIASGDLQVHVQHQWMYDALIFEVQSAFKNGVLVHIPMNIEASTSDDVASDL